MCVLASQRYPPPWVLCWEGHGPVLLCTGVMVGPLHLHTFACRQTELLLTASRADCLPGPRPSPVGVVTQDGGKDGQTHQFPWDLLWDILHWTHINSSDLQTSEWGQENRFWVFCSVQCFSIQQWTRGWSEPQELRQKPNRAGVYLFGFLLVFWRILFLRYIALLCYCILIHWPQ